MPIELLSKRETDPFSLYLLIKLALREVKECYLVLVRVGETDILLLPLFIDTKSSSKFFSLSKCKKRRFLQEPIFDEIGCKISTFYSILSI
jgi:hypothetical protein